MSKTSEQFIEQSIEHIAKQLGLGKSKLFVVWYAKTLQNHKALISFYGNHELGDYIEVTYNGDKQQTYFDFYKRTRNECVDD